MYKLFLGALPLDPHQGLPWTPLGAAVSQNPCAHPTSKPWLHQCHQLKSTNSKELLCECPPDEIRGLPPA